MFSLLLIKNKNSKDEFLIFCKLVGFANNNLDELLGTAEVQFASFYSSRFITSTIKSTRLKTCKLHLCALVTHLRSNA